MSTQALLDFLLVLDGLKAVERRTMPSGLERRENSAEHSWHGALCALLFERECAFPVNVRHAAILFLMHDVPEIRAGDIFVYSAGRTGAAVLEAAALDQLLATLPAHNAQTLRALWDEFTANETPEARYANALDRLMPMLHNLAHGGLTWREYDIHLEQVLERNGLVAEVFPAVWAIVRPRIEQHFAGGRLS